MRSFGNQFGNSLYDKSRNHANQDSSYQQNQSYNQRLPQNNQQQQHSYQNDNVNRATNTNFKGVGNQQQTARQQNQLQNQAQNQTTQQQVQNSNSRNVNQNPNNQQNNAQQQHSFQNNQSFDQYEYQPLYNLGLDVIEQNGFLIVTGNNQYSYKDAIKACGFRFDSASKTWYKPVEQGVA
jgi:DNA repair and recombination protein RAD52